jgi:hypothetical protein
MTKPSFRRIAGACLVLVPFLAAYHLLPFEIFRSVLLSLAFIVTLVCVVVLVLSSLP